METQMNAPVKLPPKTMPTWKRELPEADDGAPLVRRKEIREYVRAWWQDCLFHGFQIDPCYWEGMTEGYDYSGRGLWKEWMSNEALLASFLHWCEDMRIDRHDVLNLNMIQFVMYFRFADKVHRRKRQRVLLRNKTDPRLDYKTFMKVVYFDIFPAHEESFRR